MVGPNGSGKTTLVRALTGEQELTAGQLKTGHKVSVGYLSQHGEELEWGGARTVLEAAVKRTGLTPNEARALLGRFLFSGEDAEKPLDGLSGGERKRLGLAVLVAGKSNVLILDEPTNHLDLESRESLEDALRSYEGSLLLVTHDRALLDAVGTRTVAVEQHTLHSYAGGWAEYARLREERGPLPLVESPPTLAENGGADPAKVEVTASEAARIAAPKAASVKPTVSKNRRREQQKLEQKVADAEQQLAALEDELADPAAWANEYESAKSQARHTAATRAIEAAYEELQLFEVGAAATSADVP